MGKAMVQAYWDARPCGSTELANGKDGAEFFRAHAQIRYRREPEIPLFAEFNCWAGRRVLEIGVGMGADYVRFLKAGANAVGLDLSSHSLELARENASTNGVDPKLLNADAESLPFKDRTFDLVYSWGVLHHSPDVERTISEARRVLMPRGECRVMLYHRRSLVALQLYARYGVGRSQPFADISHLFAEYLESPGTKAFTGAEVRELFSGFREIEIRSVATAYDLRLGRRWFAPRWMLRLVPSGLGWFLLVRAIK